MGDIHFPAPDTTGKRYLSDRADLSDLFDRKIVVGGDRPAISEGARQMDIADYMKRHRQMSINYSNRGQWKSRQAKPGTQQ